MTEGNPARSALIGGYLAAGIRGVRLAEAQRAPAGLLPSRWLEQHDRDNPLARPLLVHLVAVVVVIDQPPQFLTLSAFGVLRGWPDLAPRVCSSSIGCPTATASRPPVSGMRRRSMTGNTFTNSQPPSRVRANACASLSNGVLSHCARNPCCIGRG